MRAMSARKILCLLALVLTGCAPQAIASHTQAPSPTPVPATRTLPPPIVTLASATVTATPTVTASPISTATATNIPTATPLPPTPDSQAGARRVRLPILMYHYVEPWPANANEIRQGLTVRPDDFVAQMMYLDDNGYAVLSLYDLSDALAWGRPVPEKSVVITFDDGYASLMEHAFPTLAYFGFSATVFVVTEFMDRGLEAYLTWGQARELYASGWRIESHSKTHAELAGRDRDKQIYEILGSLQTLEANLGVRPRYLCYPAGKYDDLTLQLVRELDLWGAVTTRGGRAHGFADRYEWTRVRVDGRGTLQDFVNGVSGDLP